MLLDNLGKYEQSSRGAMSEASGEVTNRYSFDVFLSYAYQDIIFARKLAEWLRQSNYEVWIDEEQLVPGTQFRAGLQQGLHESRHMVVILTPEYANRHWTQRELDIFDLDADRSERRILAVQTGRDFSGVLDQTFLVHQRIQWNEEGFDPEAFWLLNCGLLGRRPGVRQRWGSNGAQLLESAYSSTASDIDREPPRTIRDIGDSEVSVKGIGSAPQALHAEIPSSKPSPGKPLDKSAGSSVKSILPELYQGFENNGPC